jgi:catechol 2,3-dioxygenase-like lactoylglutathione lyase family enzyme
MGSNRAYEIKQMSVQLVVADVERSYEFYTKTLGLDLDFRYEDFYIGIKKGPNSIHLKSGNPSAEERKNKRNNEDLDLMFYVTGIEELYAELSNKTVNLIQPLRQMPYGKEFYIADPDGYIIAFVKER